MVEPSEWSAQSAQDHFADAAETAMANVRRMADEKRSALREIDFQLTSLQRRTSSRDQKIIGLRFIAQQASDAAVSFSACRKGCNHCCHIGVDVSAEEAKLIAKATGRKLAKPKTVSFFESEAENSVHLGTPCTFLKDGACSIYQHRPFMCRTLVNMDSVDWLCRLLPGERINVPYLDLTSIQAVYAKTVLNAEFADIRDWFAPENPQ